MKALGDINVPLTPAFGPLNFSKSQSGNRSSQIYKYDVKTKTAKPFGPAITIN